MKVQDCPYTKEILEKIAKTNDAKEKEKLITFIRSRICGIPADRTVCCEKYEECAHYPNLPHCFLYLNYRCFDPKTKVMKHNGQYVLVEDLIVGDRIMTLKKLENSTILSLKAFTTVTTAEIIKGSFNAHKFIFENGKTITVTSSHLMIILKDGIINNLAQVMAMDARFNDVMLFEEGKISKVVKIEDVKLLNKVNIETDAGNLYANDIFVTSMCENLEEIKAKNHINSYKSS